MGCHCLLHLAKGWDQGVLELSQPHDLCNNQGQEHLTEYALCQAGCLPSMTIKRAEICSHLLLTWFSSKCFAQRRACSAMSDSCFPMDCSLPGSSVHRILQGEYWNGLPFPSPGNLLDQGLNTRLLHCRQILYHLSYLGGLIYLKEANLYRKGILPRRARLTYGSIWSFV